MAWVKIPIQEQWSNANDVNAAGYVIKCYLPGTTTVTPMAIDKNGVTTVTTATLNADGFPEVSGNEVALYIDRDFKIAIYQNSSDAAANTNAFWGPVDNVKINSFSSEFQSKYWLDDYTALRAITTTSYLDDDVITLTDSGITGSGVLKNVASHGLTDNGGTIIVINSNWYWERIFSIAADARQFGCDNTGLVQTGAALQAAVTNSETVYLSDGEYLNQSNIDFGLSTPQALIGNGHASIISMTGNSRISLGASENKKTFMNFVVDGNKPTVGWETTNNYDVGLELGTQSGSVKGNYRVCNVEFRDVGLDGVRIKNTDTAIVNNAYFENCRRAGIALTGGNAGTSNIILSNIMVNQDFDGGPVGKERPLFSVDFEPDAGQDLKWAMLDGFISIQGEISFYEPSTANLQDSVCRNGIIHGEYSSLDVQNCDTVVSDVHICDDGYLLIDGDGDTILSTPYLADLTFNYTSRTEKPNTTSGRMNILPYDFINVNDGTQNLSGTGTIAESPLVLDCGTRINASLFSIAAGTGVASANITTQGTIAVGDNVVILLEVDRQDGSGTESTFRVNLASGGDTVIDRTAPLPVGKKQWISFGVSSSVAVTNPVFLVGLSGTVAALTSVRVRKAFIFVNPKRIDMPSLNVGDAFARRTFTATLTGCTTSPTDTVSYSHDGTTATLLIPSISATSNTTAATLTGMPSIIWPTRQQTVIIGVRDNGVLKIGSADISTAGVITLYNVYDPFTNSGTKGVIQTAITYSLL